MSIATAIGLFLIPVCYVFVQQIVERGSKKTPATATTAPEPEEVAVEAPAETAGHG
jgi:hypothetical protein